MSPVGTLSRATVTLKRHTVAINLEITCKKINNTKSVYNKATFHNKQINLSIDRLFHKYQPKRIYLALNTQIAIENSFNIIQWNIKSFSQQLQGYATASDYIKNIIGMKCGPLVKYKNFSVDTFFTDVFYLYMKETVNQCFKNDHIRYNFVLEKKNRNNWYELSPFDCNDGYYHFNEPINNLFTITLESFQKVVNFGQESFTKRSIITNSFDLNSLSGPPLTVTLTEPYTNAVIGDTIIMQGFKIISTKLTNTNTPQQFLYDIFTQETINQLNSPAGFKITSISGGGSTFVLDSNITIIPSQFVVYISPTFSLDTVFYNFYANGPAPTVTFASKTSTIIPMEFICMNDGRG